jgi:hypothetical protein
MEPVAFKGTQEGEFFCSDFEFCSISLLVMLKYLGFVKKKFLLGHYRGTIVSAPLMALSNSFFFYKI